MTLEFIGWQAALLQTLQAVFSMLNLLIFIRVILSWFPPSDHPLVQGIFWATEPILAPFRLLLPVGPIGLDISPIIAIFVLSGVYQVLRGLLIGI